MVSNPIRYESRYRLARAFMQHMEESDVALYLCEVQQGAREFVLTEKGSPRQLQLRTDAVLWHKENALNLMIKKLAPEVKYVGFFDADITFPQRNWVDEMWHELQLHNVIQMWQTCTDLCPKGTHMPGTSRGFVSQYRNTNQDVKRYQAWHPGFAWAWRRDVLEAMGGLIDVSIIGGADRTMALALINRVSESGDCLVGSKSYQDHMLAWQARAEKLVRRNVGYAKLRIEHAFHGRKKQRAYESRYKILADAHYDPRIDLERDENGLYKLVDHGNERDIKLRDGLLGYLSARNEDSIDLE